MKTLIRVIFLIVIFFSYSVYASELSDNKSKALLGDIRQDISHSLSQVGKLEGNNDWSVSLLKHGRGTTPLGAVIEASSNLVLSVSANGIAQQLGVISGDRLQKLWVGEELYLDNFSKVKMSEGDQVRLLLLRAGERIESSLKIQNINFPSWKLLSDPGSEDVTTLKKVKLINNISSSKGKELLRQLELRVNKKLAEIYRVESEHAGMRFGFEVMQAPLEMYELGLSIDQSDQVVISVDANSNADRLGLMKGDRVVGITLNGELYKNKLATLSVEEGDHVQVQVMRNDELYSFATEIEPTTIPSWYLTVNDATKPKLSGCGVVTFLFTPKLVQDIYNVEASQIDGESVLISKTIHQLKAGQHSLKLYDKIPAKELLPSINTSKRFYRESKMLDLIVESDKRYFIGAKFDRNKRYKTRGGAYWEPVILKVEDYKCSLD
ncbi:hypothetical protein [Kangiella marina]|uniref:PDZ domain-containing protein n=1 Tax=Kangiella marina TaxID=1079178 RepID=A0ABP8I9G2_9GAMM